jgi:MIP family channel proteins
MTLKNKLIAEFFGTFWLVFGGCGSAVLAAKFLAMEGATPINLGIGFVGVSLAFGLTVMTMAYAIGHISGCHLNPAVSVGLCVGGRFDKSELLPYIIAQVIGGAAGAGVLAIIAGGQAGFSFTGGFASNGFGEHSPGNYSMMAAFTAEVVLTFFFLMIILGATDKRATGLRSHRHRPWSHIDSPHRYPRHQSIREPRPQHRTRPLRRWLGDPTTLAVLDCPHHRSGTRRRGLSADGWLGFG